MGIMPLIQGAYYVIAGANILSHLTPHASARARSGSANPRRASHHKYGFTAFDYGLYNTSQDVPERWTTNLGIAFEFKRNLVPLADSRRDELPQDYVPPDQPLTVRLKFDCRDLAQPNSASFATPEVVLEFRPDFTHLPISVMYDRNQASIRPSPGAAPIQVSLLDSFGDTSPESHTVAPGLPIFYLPFEPPTTDLNVAYNHNFKISIAVIVWEPSWDAFELWFNPAGDDISVGWLAHDEQKVQVVNYDAV